MKEHFLECFRPIAVIEYAQNAIELRAIRRANDLHPLRDGREKRRLARSGAANNAIIATKDQQLGKPCTALLKGQSSAFSGTSRGRRASRMKLQLDTPQTARCSGLYASGCALRAFPNPSSKQRHIIHRVVLAVKRPQRAAVGAGSGSQQVVF